MVLKLYFSRLYDTVFSRRGVVVEYFAATEDSSRQTLVIQGRLRYWDNSMLRFNEELVEDRFELRKVEYVYHYQQQDGALVFRYDNVPHYPELPTHPHHKHIGTGTAELVEAAQPPQLADVLREVERFLASRS